MMLLFSPYSFSVDENKPLLAIFLLFIGIDPHQNN